MTRFLIVDDHPLLREALQSAVRIAHADAEVFEATSIEGAIDVADAHRDLDLALLDLSLPGTTENEPQPIASAEIPPLADEVAERLIHEDTRTEAA